MGTVHSDQAFYIHLRLQNFYILFTFITSHLFKELLDNLLRGIRLTKRTAKGFAEYLENITIAAR